MALFAYRLFTFLLTPVLIIALLLRSLTNKGFRSGLASRLGIVPTHFKANGIVVHAASVGEVIALKSYINQLLISFPDSPITLTTFTPTGGSQVQALFGDKVQHCFLPLDVLPCTWLFLKMLKPKAVVLMETEIWPNFIAQCAKRNIKLHLLNARLSDKSLPRYQKLSALISPCLRQFDQILAQSDDNRNRFISLGASPEKTTVTGNLKYDLSLSNELREKAQTLALHLNQSEHIWLVASTHEGDEALTLESFARIKQSLPDCLLILVPRHPERFETCYQLCLDAGFNTVKRSDGTELTKETDIWLINTLGELSAIYALANVITMGGSFSSIGGHNPLEPALHSKAITWGPDMRNFQAVADLMLAQQAAIQINLPTDDPNMAKVLADEVTELLKNKPFNTELGNCRT